MKRKRAVILLAVSGCMLLGASCSPGSGEGSMNAEKKLVHKALGADRWFPADGAELRAMVSGFIDRAEAPEVNGRIVSAVAPHAGYIYSGKVAGATFRAIRDNAKKGQAPETVVILGFSHRAGFRGVALMDGDAVETPLGRTALDKDAAAALAQDTDRIAANYAPHAGEHSAENEIPFVQVALPDAKLVVGLIGDHDAKTVDALVRALAALAAKKRILVVASSDMLHDPDYELVTRTDKATLKQVEAMDAAGLAGGWSMHSQTMCGICPVMTAMRFAAELGCRKGQVLQYRNSGDDHPSSRGQWVVGYGSVVFALPDGDVRVKENSTVSR